MDPLDPIIKLVIGSSDPPVTATVHRGVLCKSSEFFKRALKLEWANLRDDPNVINLSEEDLDMVTLYIQWLYSGDIEYPAATRTSLNTCSDIEGESANIIYLVLAKAYIFGQKYLDTNFRNAIVAQIIKTNGKYAFTPGPESVTIIYNGTSSTSPARLLLADFAAYWASDEPTWNNEFESYPRDALLDVVKAMAALRVKPVPDGDYPWLTTPEKYQEVGEK